MAESPVSEGSPSSADHEVLMGVSLGLLLSRWGAACGDEFSGDDGCV